MAMKMKIAILYITTLIYVVVGEEMMASTDKKICNPSEKVLNLVHEACRNSWAELYKSSDENLKVDKRLAKQCPFFCDNIEKDCVWKIGCRRCTTLVSLCGQDFMKDHCLAYIAKNEKTTDLERCPQYEYCSTDSNTMTQIRNTCEDIYSTWEQEFNTGVKVADLSGAQCDKFCFDEDKKERKDCAWRHVCRKCQILLNIKKSPGEFATNKFKEIIAKSKGDRCNEYTGLVMPFWYVTGDWF